MITTLNSIIGNRYTVTMQRKHKSRDIKKVIDYNQEIQQLHTADKPWHHEEDLQLNEIQKIPERQSRAANTLFTIKIIAKQEITSSTAQQIMEQT